MISNAERIAAEPVPESHRLRRAAWAGAVVVAIVGAGLYAWDTIGVRREIQAARRALDAKQLDQADLIIEKMLRLRPNQSETHYLSARLALARKNPDEALQRLAKARALGHPQPALERLVGLIHAGMGDDAKAEPLLRQSWDLLPGPDPEVADQLCRIYFQSYRFTPALLVADRWMKESPDDLRPLLWRAEIHTRSDPGPAVQIRDFDSILARDPSQYRALLGRATALRELGKFDLAKKDYDAYLKARPDDPDGHVGAAKSAEGLDDEDAALEHYEQVLKLDPNNVVGLLGVASIKIRRKDAKGALPLLDRAIAREPNDPEAYYRKGQALDRLGRREEAKTQFATQARLQKEQTQIENIRKGLVRDPNNVSLMADAAAWLLGHGYDEEGLVWAEKTLAKESGHLATLKLLADYYAKKGNAGRANFYRSQLPRGSAP